MVKNKYPDKLLNDPKQEVAEAARRVQQALTRLGHCYLTKDGRLVEVGFSRLGVVGEQYGLLEVDTTRLPPRVNVARLVHPDTLHHLTAVVGKPVKRLNTTGLTYCVVLKPSPRKRLPKRIELDLTTRPAGEYMVPIGEGREGPVWRSLLDTSHVLIGGESRSGKSTWLNAMLVSLLNVYGPDSLRLALVDPKSVEFVAYRGIPHLLTGVATEVDDATAVTEALIAEMERRQSLFTAIMARNLVSYNAKADEPLPLVIAVIDEVTDIALQAGLRSPFYTNLIRLASKAGSFGIVLVLATQNPKAEVLNTLIRGNMSTRIAFRVATPEHSRVILGVGGAQNIPQTIRGRMMARLDARPVELQGYLVDDDVVKAITNRLRAQPPSPLSTEEAQLVLYAMHYLDGLFKIRELHEAFPGLSYRRIKRISQRWERRGWLRPGSTRRDSKVVTPELAQVANVTLANQLCGVGPRPKSRSHGHTGHTRSHDVENGHTDGHTGES
ncbi:MAG: DNA translocase FtsK [Anaerolineae bacterium]|nr:DNA translocase FtsK [Anaerolineae bacterium]